MGRLLCIDFGRKRCGIAVTDTLKICATGLPTVRTCDAIKFLSDYCNKETVDAIIVGEPKDMQGNPSESTRFLNPFLLKLKQSLPNVPIIRFDERFTSSIAHKEMLSAGFTKSQRKDKAKVDEMAATIILNSYLESRQFKESEK